MVKRMGYGLGLVLGVLYILNPGAGTFELIPDMLPLIGNLDEAAAVALVMRCLHGWRAGSGAGAAPSTTTSSDDSV